MFGGYDGRGKLGPVMCAELMFLEVFARLIEVEKSGRALVEFLRGPELERTGGRLVVDRRRRERLETELLVTVGVVEMEGLVLLRETGRRGRITDLAGVHDGSRIARVRSERLIVSPERTRLMVRLLIGLFERTRLMVGLMVRLFERFDRCAERFQSRFVFQTERRFEQVST